MARVSLVAITRRRRTVSFPSEAGETRRVAVKVIDFRENEVVRVVPRGISLSQKG